MIERLFLDGIDTESRGAAIADQLYLIVETLTHIAQPTLTLPQTAMPRTQVALNPAIPEQMPESCWYNSAVHTLLLGADAPISQL